MFLIPGSGNAVRANGRAHLSVDPELLASVQGRRRRRRAASMVMNVDEIYFQCARAIVRSDLWNPDKRVDPEDAADARPDPRRDEREQGRRRAGI